MSDRIYPMAYKLAPGQVQTIYYLGFPKEWKITLLNIAREFSPHFKDDHGLPTNSLKKTVESWLNNMVGLAPLKKDTVDDHWLSSCEEFTDKKIQDICLFIKTWVISTYVSNPRASARVKQLAADFCSSINYEPFLKLRSVADVKLTHEDGTVCNEAYAAIPLMVADRLQNKEITLNGQVMRLSYATKNQLVTQPITDPESKHQYSFVFDFCVQTTPPKRKALLLCHLSIRRWIPGNYLPDNRVPYLSEDINAHIKLPNNKFCRISISYCPDLKTVDWLQRDKECYNILGYETLPSAADVLSHPENYADKILLPFKNGMSGFVTPKIEVGVPVVDKNSLHQSVGDLLADMISENPVAERIRNKRQVIPHLKSPQEYENPEEFRRWVSKCVGTDRIVFEIYGAWKDPATDDILSAIQNKIEMDFGSNTESSCLSVQCIRKEVGSLSDALPGEKKEDKIKRCDEIVRALGQADGVTACIFALPWDTEKPKVDPKKVIRNALARTGRVVQFIVPNEDVSKSKICNTVYDLYRQLGIVTLLDLNKKQPSLSNTSCVGMHICTQVHGISNKGRFLPLYVYVDVEEGNTTVECDAFPGKKFTYREACLALAKLFWMSDLEARCTSSSLSPAKQKLIQLKSRHFSKDDRVLLFVKADGNTRSVWGGISDKEIGGYELTERYCPVKINVGRPESPYMYTLKNSGVRIIRVRCNQEVPDYYTEISDRTTDEMLVYSSTSGIFKYEDVFWGIHPRVFDSQYSKSYMQSRIDHIKQRFAEKDMIELYPLQLQVGDNVEEWISYTNALRKIPIQYNQSTNLPLPLHLAQCLEEYLFDAS